MMFSPKLKMIAALFMMGAAGSVAAQASTSYTFQIAGQATATLTAGAGIITISLTDLWVNPSDVADNISAFWFTTSNAITPTISASSPNASSIIVGSGGSVTNNGSIAPGWALSEVSGVTKLSDVPGGTSVPANTIIGSPDSNGLYSNANRSITNTTGPHNPFLNGTVTWILNAAAVTTSTTFSNVTFQFGTTANSGVLGQQVTSSTPEPSTAMLFGGGVALIFLSRKFRLRRS